MQRSYITARIPTTLKQQIERIAKDERRSVSQVAEMLLEEALKRKNGGK
jgi:hypothetical protein